MKGVIFKGISGLSVAIALLLHFNYVMNHIYVYGTGMADVGWFVHLITNSNDFPIKNPEMGGLAETYFSTHFSPFFYITSFIFDILNPIVGQHVFFSLFMSAAYAIMSFSLYMVIRRDLSRWATCVLFSPIIFLISFNGVFLGSMGFPHFEVIIPSLIMLVLALYFNGKLHAATAVFIFLLLVREDAGLHAALLFFIVAILQYLESKRVARGLLLFCGVGLLYGFLAIAAQKMFFSGDDAFERIYSGNPFYAHLTVEFIVDRLAFFLDERAYIWVPWAVAVVAAFRLRSPVMLAGFLFALPWAILSMTAISPMTHRLSNYYAFPLAVSCVWTLFAFLFLKKIRFFPGGIRKTDVALAASAPVLSVFLFDGGGNVDSKPWDKVGFDYMSLYHDTAKAAEVLCDGKSAMGNVLIDESVSALMPSCIKKTEWGYLNNFHDVVKRGADVLIFYDSEFSINGRSVDKFLDIAEEADIENFHQVTGTKIVIAHKAIEVNDLGLEAGMMQEWRND